MTTDPHITFAAAQDRLRRLFRRLEHQVEAIDEHFPFDSEVLKLLIATDCGHWVQPPEKDHEYFVTREVDLRITFAEVNDILLATYRLWHEENEKLARARGLKNE